MARICGRHECRFLALIPSQVRPEMFLADPRALLVSEVAPMSFIVDDAFYDDPDVRSLPACSLAFLMLAGPWSARNSQSGFVPTRMLAILSDVPDLVTQTLHAAGLIWRVKGGVQIAEGRGLTVINASRVAEQVTRDKADAEQRRAAWRERKRRQRDAKTAERQEQIAAGVTPESRGPEADVTRDKAGIQKKPQVSSSYVPRDMSVTSRSSRARTRDFDSDFNQSLLSQVGQSRVSNAGAREDDPPPGSPAFRLQVTAAFAEATGIEIDDATADVLAAEVLGKATEPVPNPLGYVRRSIAKERDPRRRWLPKRPARTAFAEPQPHCGDRLCSPLTRRREDPETGADDGPCPKCSGSAAIWEAS